MEGKGHGKVVKRKREIMEILTVHYNTPELMDAMIRSVRRFTDCTIHVFDNSDSKPFVNTFEGVDVIDNTEGQVIDFEAFLDRYPEKKPRISNYGSPKHCKTVNACFKLFPDGFILMDSDVLVKKDITELWDERFAWVGEPHLDTPKGVPVMRLLPFLCYVNVPVCREYGAKYFNGEWMWHLVDRSPNKWYDTGAWFYRDTMERNVPYRIVQIDEYIEHFNHGSHSTLNESRFDWLEKHKNLWL